MSDKRRTVFIEDAATIPAPASPAPLPSPRPKVLKRRGVDNQSRGRLYWKATEDLNKDKLVPVFSGSPWKHYKTRFRMKFGVSYGIVTAHDSGQLRMIRSITGKHEDERVQRLRQTVHPSLVHVKEIYSCEAEGNFLVAEYMMTSLRHVCRSPIYPNEPQLSSILHQVLSGLDFLLGNKLVHEDLSAANVLMNCNGEVKICDVDACYEGGDIIKLWDSFGRLMMRLMDKQKDEAHHAVGLTRPNQWSSEAVDMFSMATSQTSVVDLLGQKFLQKREQKELIWLVPYVAFTALHSTE